MVKTRHSTLNFLNQSGLTGNPQAKKRAKGCSRGPVVSDRMLGEPVLKYRVEHILGLLESSNTRRLFPGLGVKMLLNCI